ncbi:MAG: hypothetical protein FJ087_02320 [Deltaproteobacteria bacterium]|nr:hypothetical protein [Deltaproteobacteria bacterium]
MSRKTVWRAAVLAVSALAAAGAAIGCGTGGASGGPADLPGDVPVQADADVPGDSAADPAADRRPDPVGDDGPEATADADPDALPDGEADPGPDGTAEDAADATDAPGPDAAGPDADVQPCESDDDCEAAAVPPCKALRCDARAGHCVMADLPDGAACKPLTACETNGRCVAGACAGVQVSCDDGNPCTDDTCDDHDGCGHTANAAACDDGNPCTPESACANTVCAGIGNDCPCAGDADCAPKEDGNRCNGLLICAGGHCEVDQSTVISCAPRAPGACTAAACDPATGACGQRPVPDGRACDDGSSCTAGDACVEGACVGLFVPCDDGNPCTDDSCDAAVGCLHAANAAPCDDGDPCTTGDACAGGKCGGVPVPGGCGCAVDADCAKHEDGNACNGTLACVAGTCAVDTATVVTCDPSGNTACAKAACDPATGECARVPANEGAACDDGNPCTAGETCVAGACAGDDPTDCGDGNDCTDDLCDPASGCRSVGSVSSCEDGDPCTAGDACEAGACVGGGPADCDDGNPCTSDSCDQGTGCAHDPNEAPCDDLDPCTVGDACAAGGCAGTIPLDCSDGNPCTDDGCDPATGCGHEPNAAACDDRNPCTAGDACTLGICAGFQATSCDDGNDCTRDTCDPAAGCGHEALTGTPCADGSACTGGDTCAAGACVPGPAVLCDDGNACTDDRCDPAAGCTFTANTLACDDGSACTAGDACRDPFCTGAVAECDDGNPCTDDSCDPDAGCAYVANAAPCDDGNACTTGDACSLGRCEGGPATDCGDGNPCTSETCLPAVGCLVVPNQNACDDANACTEGDRCANGTCVPGAPRTCDDRNACTADGCSASAGCVFTATNEGGACDDGNACTLGDACALGRCVGTGLQCDDDNPCTDDKCSAEAGCHYVANTLPCDDGNACTTGDTCSNKQCAPKGTLACKDDNGCTDDYCDRVLGCFHIYNTSPCEDGSQCTTGETCSQGRCVGGQPTDCDDHNLCTTDSCDPAVGCVNAPNALPCDDGDKCTTGDACSQGGCAGGPPPDCGDNNPCTDDTCLAGVGCVHIYNTGACDDSNKCTTGDACRQGKCVGGPPPVCEDQNPCTTDRCDPGLGCVFQYNTLPCDDGKVCTKGEACSLGECVGGTPAVCDDGNPCTDDGCAEPDGCVHTDNSAACSDNDACTNPDFCSQGKCAGKPVTCDDQNECTADSCAPAIGCVRTPVPNGLPCTGKFRQCWNGKCVGWEFRTSSYTGTTDTRLHEGGRPTNGAALHASGADDYYGAPGPTIFSINASTLVLSVAHDYYGTTGSYQTQAGRLASGTGGIASRYSGSTYDPWTESGAPAYGTKADMLATTFLPTPIGERYFVTGKPLVSSAGSPWSTIRSCTSAGAGGTFACTAMALIDKPSTCVQKSAELRGAYAAAQDRAYFVGFEPTALDGNVVIASWDGNSSGPCGGLTFTGAAWWNAGPHDLVEPATVNGPGALNDVHGTGPTDVWAVGERGTVYRFDGKAWSRASPAKDLPASGWGAMHDAQAVWADAGSGVHVVGNRQTGDFAACRVPFYLHAGPNEKGVTVFNNYFEFTAYQACGDETTRRRTSLSDVWVDPSSGSVYAFGWAPDAAAPTANLGLVMRLARP